MHTAGPIGYRLTFGVVSDGDFFRITVQLLLSHIRSNLALLSRGGRGDSIVISRDEMIAVLICDTVERIAISKHVFWLQCILEDGFSGFAQWSDEELISELQDRGLNGLESAINGPTSSREEVERQEQCDDMNTNVEWDDGGLMLEHGSVTGLRNNHLME